MSGEIEKNLLVVHYHFRPGGVRRVLELLLPQFARHFESITLLGGETPDPAWQRAIKRQIPRLRFVVNPAFHYFEAQPNPPHQVREDIRETLSREAKDGTLVWVHNPALGRNMILADEVAAWSAGTGTRVVCHHHDFWCDRRWARWPTIRAQGFRTLSGVSRAAFAAGSRVLHAGINSSDVRLLSRHMDCAAWLPNPAGEMARPGKSAIAQARRWLRDQIGGSAPVWIYPARFLRRKNFAEAILLARWLAPDAVLVTTGGVSSPDEHAYATRLQAAAAKHRWRVRFGILANRAGRAPEVPDLLCAAESMVMTSIQEGFGFPYLEGAALGCRLIARRLPTIQPDLESFGVSLPGLYGEILIPPALFDAKAECARQRSLLQGWKSRLPASCRRMAGIPRFLEEPSSPVAFSRLTLDAQLEVLSVPAKESLEACAGLNAFLHTLVSTAPVEWTMASHLAPALCAETFLGHLAHFPRTSPSPLQAGNTQRGIIAERLGGEFLHPLLLGQ